MDTVKTFTFQVDPDKRAKCEHLKAIAEGVINILIDTSISVITDGMGGVLTNWISKEITKLEKQVSKNIQITRFVKAINAIKDKMGFKQIDWKKAEESLENRLKLVETIDKFSKSKEFTHMERRGWKALLREAEADHGLRAWDIPKMVEKLAMPATEKFNPKLWHKTNIKPPAPIDAETWLKLQDHNWPHWKRFSEFAWPLEANARQAFLTPFLRIPQNAAGVRQHIDQFTHHDKDASLWQNSLVNDAYKSWPGRRLKEKQREQAQAGLRGSHTELPTIITGTGHGWMCSEYEGDWEDLNNENLPLLQKRVNAELYSARRQVWTVFDDMYHGVIPEPGHPSFMSRWFLARKWLGRDELGTVEYELEHVEEFYK